MKHQEKLKIYRIPGDDASESARLRLQHWRLYLRVQELEGRVDMAECAVGVLVVALLSLGVLLLGAFVS